MQVLFTLSQGTAGTAARNGVVNTGHIHLPAHQFLLKDGLVGWWRFYCWLRVLVTGLLSQERNLHQCGFSKGRYIGQLLGQISRMFSSRQSILDRAGLPTVSLNSVGNNCFDGAPGSAFLLQPFIGSRRLKIGATQIGSQPYTDFSLTDNRTQLNRLARQPALYPFLRAEGGGGTGFSASQK